MIKGGKELEKDSKLLEKVIEDFGSYKNWENDFKAVGLMRGIGWAILYYDQMEDDSSMLGLMSMMLVIFLEQLPF
jgi:superoxide dismutase